MLLVLCTVFAFHSISAHLQIKMIRCLTSYAVCVSRRQCASVSPSLVEWAVSAQQALSDMEMLSTSHVPSPSPATSVVPSSPPRDQLQTLSQEITSNIEVLLSSAPSPLSTALSSVLLAGIDMKAVLCDGALSSLQVVGKDISRADFTGVSIVACSMQQCDLSRGIFYRTAFCGCTFEGCRFDAAILKGCTFSEGGHRPMFVNCSFRFCALDVSAIVASAPQKRRTAANSTAIFHNCDFQFAEVKTGRARNDVGAFFVDCRGLKFSE